MKCEHLGDVLHMFSAATEKNSVDLHLPTSSITGGIIQNEESF